MWQFSLRYFMELNAFSAAIKRTASVSILTVYLWVAAPAPSSWHVLSFKDLAAFVTFFFHDTITTLPVILLSTSTKTGLPAFLSTGINMLAVKASNDWVDSNTFEQTFLMGFTKALLRSLDGFPNCLEVNILPQLSASRSDGVEPPLCCHIRQGELVLMDTVEKFLVKIP